MSVLVGPVEKPMVRLLRKVTNQTPGSSTPVACVWCVSCLAGRPDRRLSRNICRLVFPAVSGPRSTRAMVRPLGLIGKFGASGKGRERSGDDDWKGNGGSPESAPYQYHFGRPAGPSHRFFPARTMKMPSSGSSGAMDGTGQIGFYSSKTTPEPSGSTAKCWKMPAMPEMEYML